MLLHCVDKAMKNLLSPASLRRLAGDDHGNVAMMTALAIIPLTVASLGAVDLTRGIAARVELQDALDAAALAAGRSSTQDPKELDSIGKRILSQNLTASGGLTVKASSFTFGGDGRVLASVDASYQPLLGGLGGDGEISARTEVKRANSILEIALVLDNTGSMDGTKITNLRTAASSFVSIMKKASDQTTTPKSIQIALVPFSNTVKIGSTYRNAAWMDQNGVSPINDEIFTTSQGVTQKGDRWAYFDKIDAWRGCVEMRKAPYDVQADAPATNTPATLFTPMFAPDEFDTNEDGVNDYLKDPRDAQGNRLDWWTAQGDVKKYSNTPKVTVGTSKGPNAGCSMQPVQRLTTDFSALTTAIGKMAPKGETNIPNGLLWGWLTLSPNAPFSDGVAYLKPKHRKIVVLMTDGDNTLLDNDDSKNRSTYSAAGFVWQGRLVQKDDKALTSLTSSQDTRTAALDHRLKLLCTNMKKSDVGIEIYTVGVGVSDNAKKLLQECASGADHYFDVKGTDMTAAFQSVANQISQLHLAK